MSRGVFTISTKPAFTEPEIPDGETLKRKQIEADKCDIRDLGSVERFEEVRGRPPMPEAMPDHMTESELEKAALRRERTAQGLLSIIASHRRRNLVEAGLIGDDLHMRGLVNHEVRAAARGIGDTWALYKALRKNPPHEKSADFIEAMELLADKEAGR